MCEMGGNLKHLFSSSNLSIFNFQMSISSAISVCSYPCLLFCFEFIDT